VTVRRTLASTRDDLFAAVQFLTRIPVPDFPYTAVSMPSAATLFPIVGLLLGLLAASMHRILVPHLPRTLTALLVVTFLVLLTGALHEDALADAADGFGGGRSREQILAIFKDSRIGSYGAAALFLALLARVSLIASLPYEKVFGVLIAAIVLSRWTILPLSFYLPSARIVAVEASDAGQGARIAHRTSAASLMVGSLTTLAIVAALLRSHALAAILAAALVTLLTGIYYHRRIGGVTGDCFGATIQLAEIAVLLTGVWVA
jgi:adenosylcobinamide-GDP ribazoletransferase